MKQCRTAQRKWNKHHNRRDWKKFTKLRNKKGHMTKACLRKGWKDRTSDITTTKRLWSLNKQLKSKFAPRPYFISPLRKAVNSTDLATSTEDKAEALKQEFFPPSKDADLDDLEGYQYPEPVPWEPLRKHEIEEAINSSHPNKAAGPKGTTFQVLQTALPVIKSRITQIFNACLELGQCPKAFRDFITVVPRKAGKPDYTEPKAFRSIALLETLGKAMEKVMATRISYLVEERHLLLGMHTGGRKTTSPENAIHMVMEAIAAAWKSTAPCRHPHHARRFRSLGQRRSPQTAAHLTEKKDPRDRGKMDCQLHQQQDNNDTFSRRRLKSISRLDRHSSRIPHFADPLPLLQRRHRRHLRRKRARVAPIR